MSYHELSSVLALPQFDVFAVPPTQLQVIEDITIDHTPFSAITHNMTPIQFTTSTVDDEYIILRKSELYIKMRIELRQKSSIDKLSVNDWKKICPINYLLNTMWKSVKLEIDSFPVTSTTMNYPYIAYMDALMNIPKDVKNTHLRTALWHKDSAGRMDSISELRSQEIRPINDDFGQSCEIEMVGYLHLDLCAQIRALLGGLRNINLTLYPNDPSFYLMYDDKAIEPLVRFQEVKFEFHKAKVTPQLELAHKRALHRTTAKYPITRKDCRNFVIQKDMIEYHENNVIKNDRLPRKCFLAFVSNDAFNGVPSLNPFNFKHYNILNIRCVLNSKEYPPRGLECNFESRLINKAYRVLFEAMGQIDNPRFSISRSEYIDGFTIFGFNFIPDLSDGVNRNGYVSPIKVGDMSLHIRFRTPLPETVTAIVYMEYDNIIEIPETKLPFKDFQ